MLQSSSPIPVSTLEETRRPHPEPTGCRWITTAVREGDISRPLSEGEALPEGEEEALSVKPPMFKPQMRHPSEEPVPAPTV